MSTEGPPVDSPEGIALLVAWARAHGAVLTPYHRDIAAKHSVDVAGIVFSDPMPLSIAPPTLMENIVQR